MGNEILSTTNYGMFKKCQYNRELQESHVQHMIKNLTKMNLLHLHPIIINEDFEIISGQHRFEAAKRMKIPIFYVKEHNIPEDFVLTSNTIQKKSGTADSIHYYATRHKIASYVFLDKIIKRLKISAKAVTFLLLNSGNNDTYLKIKHGELKFTVLEVVRMEEIVEEYEDFKDWAIENKLKPYCMYNAMGFCGAFRHFLNLEPDMEYFKNKILMHWQDFKRQPTGALFRKMMVEIYNKGQRKNFLIDTYEKEEK